MWKKGYWFDPLPLKAILFWWISNCHFEGIFSLSADHCLDNVYLGKQPMTLEGCINVPAAGT